MQTRDGIRLDADVYRPEGKGPFPVLLMRQPYGRSIASTVVYAHPIWYAAHGYIVVIQDVRGRGTSAGSFYPFATEILDGFDTVEWAAALAGSTGDVGMYGFSYQGMTQLFAASAKPDGLKALCPAMMAYDLYEDMAYEGRAFRLQGKLGWGIQLAAETARLKGDVEAHQALLAASRQLPLTDPTPCRPEVMRRFAPESFYFDWLDHPDPNSNYWQRYSPKTHLAGVDLPMLHIGGWFDSYLKGNLGLFQAMTSRSRHPQHLIIGPWPHIPWGRQVGGIDYGPEAVNLVDRIQIRWFDQFLKGIDTGLLNEDPIRVFEMGSNQWRYFKTWPGSEPTPLYLSTTGLASASEAEGSLTFNQPDPCSPDVCVHDPWRPVPTLGGHNGSPPGCFDRAALDCRTDVLTYTTKPLEEDLHLAGDLMAEIFCSSDQNSFDLCAILSEVTLSGKVWSFSQGYRRILPGESVPIPICLQSTCIRIPKGHALRLSLSGACYPAFAINPGTGAQPGEMRLIDAQIITLSVRSGGETASVIQIPRL